MPTEPPKFWAFISYSHADRHWADWLHRELERYPIPVSMAGTANSRGETIPARFRPIFRDREELAAADDLGREITAALQQSRYLIVICSRRAAQSRWVDREILAFKRLGGERRVRCLIVDGEPWASTSEGKFPVADECFPPSVRQRLGEDGELSDLPAEPIAADARPHADGKENAFLKLFAGLLGVEFDALKRRDDEYRRRQLRKVRLLALLFALLAVAACAAGWYARQQRAAALTALSRADFEYGSEKIDSGATAQGVAYLARALRNDASNRAATQRLWSLLAQRTHLLPMAPAIRLESDLFQYEYSPDGAQLLVQTVKEGVRFADPSTGILSPEPFRPRDWLLQTTRFLTGGNLLTLGDYSGVTPDARIEKLDSAWQKWTLPGRTRLGPAYPTGAKLDFARTALDPEGHAAAAWNYDGREVGVWNLDTGARLGPPIKLERPITAVSLMPGAKGLAVIEDKQRLHVFDPATGQPLGAPGTAPKDGAFEDFRLVGSQFLVLMTGKNQRDERIWQLVDGGTNKPLGTYVDAGYRLRSAAIDSTGLRIVGEGMDDRLHLILMRNLGVPLAEPVPHRGNQPPLIRPDGRQIATQYDRRTIVLRHAAPSIPGGRTLLATRGAMDACLSPDGKVIAAQRESDSLQLFDATTGAARGEPLKHAGLITTRAFSADGRFLATGSADVTARTWSTADGKPVGPELQHDGPLTSVEFSPDGRFLLTVARRNLVRLWEVASGAPVLSCPGLGLVQGVGFLAGGRQFYFARGRSLECWKVEPAECVRTIPLDSLASVDAASASADGRFAAAAVGLTLQVWSLADGRSASSAISLREPAVALAFDPTGDHVLFRSRNEARIWSWRDGREASPPLRLMGLKQASFSPDGSLLLTTYGAKGRVWDWRSGRPVTDEFRSVFAASFSADGRQIVRGRDYVVELASVPPVDPAPAWLGEVAEAVFQERLRDDGIIETVPCEAWLALRERLAASTSLDYWSRFGRWFASDPWRRTVTLDSTDLTEDFLRSQMPELQAIMAESEQEK